MDDLVRPEIAAIKPYHVENHPCDVVLDANENPFSLPDELTKELESLSGRMEINKYPDPGSRRLKESLAERDGVGADRLLIGNGSDEIIQMILSVFCPKGTKVLFPVPTFSMYSLITSMWGGIPIECPLNSEWDINLPAFTETMKREKPAVLFLATPNNPTGNCFSREKALNILQEFEGIVVIDEAYYHFAGETFLKLLDDFPKLIILRSLSKIGLAGLRLGYCIASPKIVDYLNRVRLPYNISSFSQSAAGVLLKNWDVLNEQIEWIQQERGRVFNLMKEAQRITPFPSSANFILFRLEEGRGDPSEFFNQLIGQGIRIRDFSKAPFLKRCFRVTIGTKEENDAFLKAIEREK